MTTNRKPFAERYVTRAEHKYMLAFAEKVLAETIAKDNALIAKLQAERNEWRKRCSELSAADWGPIVVFVGGLVGAMVEVLTR